MAGIPGFAYLDDYGVKPPYVARTDPTPTPTHGIRYPAVFDPNGGSGTGTGGTTTTTPPPSPATTDILSDPGFQAWKTGSDLALSNAAAQRRAALRALVLQFGGLGAVKDAYGDIDQATLDAANNNPYSQLNVNQRSYEQGVEAFKRGLAARGALSSGDLPTGLGQLDWQRGQEQYDLANQFGGAAQGDINRYVDTETQQKADYAKEIAAAAARVEAAGGGSNSGDGSGSGNGGGSGGGSGTGTPPPGSGTPPPTPDTNNLVWYRDPSTGEIYSMPSGTLRPGLGMQ